MPKKSREEPAFYKWKRIANAKLKKETAGMTIEERVAYNNAKAEETLKIIKQTSQEEAWENFMAHLESLPASELKSRTGRSTRRPKTNAASKVKKATTKLHP